MKVVLDHAGTNFGAGSDVPLIGNPVDAFGRVDARILFNDRFANQQLMVNIDTGEHVDQSKLLRACTVWCVP